MRSEARNHRARTALGIRTGVPTAVAGSIALVLSSVPAQAVEATQDRMPRPLPAEARTLPTTASAGSAVPAVRTVPSAKTPDTYTVRRGDTVSAIAARFGLRTTDVLALNGLSWSSVIHPGQVLALTGRGSAPATASAASGTHTVRAGDTISAIARKHGVSVKAMLSANDLGWSSIIYPGQKLSVPGKAVRAAATKPATVSKDASSAATSHVVEAGDTVTAIAQRHGVTVDAVLRANDLSRSSIIYPGQKLAIPGQRAVTGLDAEQSDNARLIIRVGREMGVSDRGIAIALGTAMQESWIRNLDWGDRDSLGLFQQRPSTGWGTADQVRDRIRSIKAFYGGPGDPNGERTRGLLDIPGWQDMSFAQAAQAVQISAYPDRYARWEKPAYAWLAALG